MAATGPSAAQTRPPKARYAAVPATAASAGFDLKWQPQWVPSGQKVPSRASRHSFENMLLLEQLPVQPATNSSSAMSIVRLNSGPWSSTHLCFTAS